MVNEGVICGRFEGFVLKMAIGRHLPVAEVWIHKSV